MEKDPLFQTLFENSAEGILIADGDGKCLDANPAACALLGRSKPQIVQSPVRELSNSSRLQASTVANVAPGRDVIFLRESAQAADRMKSSFISSISHEIRTPLNSLLGFNELLRTTDVSAEDRARFHDIISKNGEQLLRLIDDVLDLSRFEGGKTSLEARPFSLSDVLAEVSAALENSARAKHLAFRFTAAPDLPKTIAGDATRLKQVLMNLGGNAVKFTREGSVEFSVSISGDPALLIFDFKDSGIGIASEQRDQLFHPFTQEETTVARRFGGTGLGLALARKIAESMGGTVELVDSKPGLGSLFRASIAAPEGPLPALARAAEGPSPSLIGPLNGRRILLVEDSPDNQTLMRLYLENKGAKVDVANNGKMALDQAFSAEYDIVLMDLQMPVLDGRSATKLLRMKGFTAPIIALTAHATSADRDSALAAGCTDFLTKPVDLPEILGKILKGLPQK